MLLLPILIHGKIRSRHLRLRRSFLCGLQHRARRVYGQLVKIAGLIVGDIIGGNPGVHVAEGEDEIQHRYYRHAVPEQREAFLKNIPDPSRKQHCQHQQRKQHQYPEAGQLVCLNVEKHPAGRGNNHDIGTDRKKGQHDFQRPIFPEKA